jgi:chemotaxis protein MotB
MSRNDDTRRLAATVAASAAGNRRHFSGTRPRPAMLYLHRTRGVTLPKEKEMSRRRLHVAGAALAAALALAGCVSKGDYEKLESDKNQEIALLQKQRGALQEQLQGLQSQKSSLESQEADLRKQVDALEQQKAQIQTASQQDKSQYDALVKNLTEEVKKGELQVRQYKDMLTVDVAEQLFFDSGRADLKDTGKTVLKKVGEALKGYEDKVIRVVGHTDNVPIKTRVFPSNWELSVARATTVVHFLQETGIPPERMVASGRAEYQPVAENDTPEGRKKNRRIEITLIDKNLVQEAGPGKK